MPPSTDGPGGFLVEPHEGRYDLLCTAATDPYTQCGFTKLIPISRLGEFTVHHLSNKYAGRMGVDEPEMRRQIAALRQMAGSEDRAAQLFETETRLRTRLRRAAFSKDYYELPSSEAMALIPDSARTILSIGCGWGATEMALAAKGLQVTAIALDGQRRGDDPRRLPLGACVSGRTAVRLRAVPECAAPRTGPGRGSVAVRRCPVRRRAGHHPKPQHAQHPGDLALPSGRKARATGRI